MPQTVVDFYEHLHNGVEVSQRARDALLVLAYHLDMLKEDETKKLPLIEQEKQTEWSKHGYISPRLRELRRKAELAWTAERKFVKQMEVLVAKIGGTKTEALKKLDEVCAVVERIANNPNTQSTVKAAIERDWENVLATSHAFTIGITKQSENAMAEVERYKNKSHKIIADSKNEIFGHYTTLSINFSAEQSKPNKQQNACVTRN